MRALRRLTLTLACLGLTVVARAQQPAGTPPPRGVELVLRPGLLDDGAAREGWLPCEVLITNRGLRRAFELRLRVWHGGYGEQQTQRQRVELSPGQTRRLWFLVPIQAGQHGVGVEVHELTEGDAVGRQLASQRSAVDVADTNGYRRSVGVEQRVLYVRTPQEDDELDPPLDWLRAMGGRGWGRGGPRQVGQRSPVELPASPFAYDGIDLVVLHAIDCGRLDRAQSDALLAWLHTGGRLLLIPGTDRGWFQQPLLQTLIGDGPVRERTLAALPELTRAYGARRPRSPPAVVFVPADRGVPLQEVPPVNGTWESNEVPVELDDRDRRIPMAHAFQRGDGRVYLLAFDPASPAFRHWRGRIPLMDSLQQWVGRQATRWRLRHDRNGDPRVRANLVEPLDSRQRPSRLFVVAVVLLYVLCVGPLNFWLLGRRGQRERLVLTVPLLALGFTALVFGVGYLNGGLSTVTWRASVVHGRWGERWAWERSAASLLSALDPEHRIHLDPALAATRVYPTYEQAARATDALALTPRGVTADVELERWELAYCEGQRVLDLGRGIQLERDGDSVRLRNDSSLRIGRGVLFLGDPCLPLRTPALEPGESVAVAEPLPPLPVAPDQRPRRYDRAAVAASLFPTQPELAAFCTRTLETHYVVTPVEQGSLACWIALLEAPPSRIAIDERDFDRSLGLLVLEERP